MRRPIAIALFALAVSFFGCAATETTAPKTETVQPVTAGESAKPLIKCSTCGVEFTNIKDLQEHMIKFPEHKIVPIQ